MNLIRATNLKAIGCATTEVIGAVLCCDIEEVRIDISTSKGDKYTLFTKRVISDNKGSIYCGGVVDLNGKEEKT